VNLRFFLVGMVVAPNGNVEFSTLEEESL